MEHNVLYRTRLSSLELVLVIVVFVQLFVHLMVDLELLLLGAEMRGSHFVN